MKGQRYWDEKVPIYTEIKEVREIRKKKYLNEAKQYYSICKHTTNEEYNHLKNEILNGNEKAMQELLERSINPIIDALAGIYAKYYIEEYVPFEEGLSYSLEMFNKRLKAFTKFPCLWSKFSISTINFYVFNSLTFYYHSMKYNAQNVQFFSEQSLTWEIDKREYEDFSYKDCVKEDVRNRLIAVMAKLDKRMSRVLALKYGFFDGCERTFDEIAKMENISRSRAEQLVLQSLHQMRKKKNNKPLNMYSDLDLDLIN